MNFKEEYQKLMLKINEALAENLKGIQHYPPIIFQSMEHSLFAGGKRLRPILLITANKMAGGNTEESLPLACGLEMIHTYSLIHDDLPAMDDDDFRRGIPTNHKVFGEGIAILAGDGLLNLAYEIMLENALRYPSKLKQHIQAISTIAVAAGVRGMIGGQVVDLEWEGKDPDNETLDYIHTHKTGALFLAALEAGIALEDPDDQIKQAIYIYGKSLGLAFQIMDDILDVVGDPLNLGKSTGRDEKLKKATYVQKYGVNKSLKIAKELMEQAVQALDPFGINGHFLKEIAYFVVNRQS